MALCIHGFINSNQFFFGFLSRSNPGPKCYCHKHSKAMRDFLSAAWSAQPQVQPPSVPPSPAAPVQPCLVLNAVVFLCRVACVERFNTCVCVHAMCIFKFSLLPSFVSVLFVFKQDVPSFPRSTATAGAALPHRRGRPSSKGAATAAIAVASAAGSGGAASSPLALARPPALATPSYPALVS